MLAPNYQLYALLILLFLSCKSEPGYNYAVKDFRKALQPQLEKIVSSEVVSKLNQLVTDKELLELSMSEHPVLRASAVKAMLYKTSFNAFDVLMNHLDDTAMVVTSQQAFLDSRMTVSDYILREARWKSQEEKNKTIDEVITRHNYLRSAYTILPSIEPQEKYYPFIKDMALRMWTYHSYITTVSVYELQDALYAIARFKKKADVPLIKDLLLSNTYYLSTNAWRLMREFPDTSYLSVYEAYYPKNYYFLTSGDAEHSPAIDYINSIAIYKTSRSAKILDSIYNHKPFIYFPGNADTNYIRHSLISAIVNNECEAYAKLRQQIEKGIPGFDKNKFQLPEDNPVDFRKVPAGQEIRW
ncbi:hypothetical protein BH11BAC5_BH11BAC5_47820 [soil metagenome]